MARTVHYQKNAVIFFEGEKPKYIYILRTGSVEVAHISPDLKMTLYTPIKCGQFFGIETKIADTPYISRAIARENSTVTLINRDEFEKFIFKDNTIAANMIKDLCAQLKELHATMYSSDTQQIERNYERGMFHVANAFFSTNEFKSCKEMCSKLLQYYPNTSYKNELDGMINTSNTREETSTATNMPVIFEDAQETELFLPESFKKFEKEFPEHSVIFSEFEEGNSVFLVLSGIVRSTKYKKGVNANLSLARPGEFFGLNAFVDMDRRDVTCITAGQVKVMELSLDSFYDLLKACPKIAYLFIKHLATKLHIDRRIFRNNYIPDLQIRLKDMFAVLDDLGLCEHLEDKSRKIYLSPTNIHVWLGISEEDIRNELDILEQQNMISVFDEGWIIVKDIGEARRVSEGIRIVNT